jgi:hypothetical protein
MNIASPQLPVSVFSFMIKILRAPQVTAWYNEEYDEALRTLVETDCTNETELKLVEDLLLRLKVLTSKELKSYAISCANHICNNWKLLPDKTVITAMHNKDDPDGSELTMNILKSRLPNTPNWKKNLFTNTDAASHAVPSDGIMIIVEDFVGTGTKVRDFINGKPANGKYSRVIGLREKLNTAGKPNVEIRLVTFVALQGALENLQQLFNANNYWIGDTEARGISDHYPPEEKQDKINTMLSLEQKLSFGKDYSLGYKQSEALVAIEAHSAPNNLFPIFWCEKYANNTERVSLFPRR